LLVLVAIVTASLPSAPRAAACAPEIAAATRLMVVVAPGMNAPTGKAQLYRRDDLGADWQTSGASVPVSLGRNGLGWSFDQTGYAAATGQAAMVKREGDGRSPAGFFAAGRPFGFTERNLADYLRIDAGTICVDDPASPLYNRVTRIENVAPGVSHEKMWEISLYRAGLIVDTPTSRQARSGSCIFLHVWRAPGSPTAGCVAMSEANMATVQYLFDGERAAVAILPEGALSLLASCGVLLP